MNKLIQQIPGLSDHRQIALIGMSNIGKSRMALQIARTFDAPVYEIDKQISRQLDHKSLTETASWLGLPDEEGYAERAQQYLILEEKALRAAQVNNRLILDTAGSLPHLTRAVHIWLKKNFFVVYLEPTAECEEELKDKFFEFPKPVIWGDYYQPLSLEAREVTIQRCYNDLLQARASIFRSLANISLKVSQSGTFDVTKSIS